MHELTGSTHWYRRGFLSVFGVTRIPALPHDWNTRPSPDTTHLPEKQANKANPPSRHITVTVRNNYYELQVVEPTEGKILRPEAIEEGLKAIVQDAKSREDGQGVGVLSSDERDTWAQTREHLLGISEVNRASVKSIETSLLAITLDTSVLPLPSDFPAPSSSASQLWVDALARNCSGAGRGGHNRWFDKSMTLVVEPNGRAGINGEHSPVDALIPSILADYATGVPCPPLGTPLPQSVDTTPEEMYSEAKAAFTRRDFEVDQKLREEIDKSTTRALALTADSDIRVLYYDEYGADWIKKVGKQSPDAYLQMALQVAMALTHTWQVPTYETASTRLFRNGRTDVIRTFSTESYAFVKALTREKAEGKEGMKKLYKLLTAATVSHNAQTRESSLGRGIDRHLTGLRLVYNPATDEQSGGMPKLLSDDLFGKSQTWTLSTSGLSAGDRLAGTGFGAGYPDGYGCNCECLFSRRISNVLMFAFHRPRRRTLAEIRLGVETLEPRHINYRLCAEPRQGFTHDEGGLRTGC
jgi:carnitine O-acetyltransferase